MVKFLALLSLIPFYQATQGVEPWVKPTFWVIFLGALIVGGVCNYFGKQQRQVVKTSSDEVARDMEDIYESFFSGEKIQD